MGNVIKVHKDTWEINKVNTKDLAWQCEALAERLVLYSAPSNTKLLYKVMTRNLARRQVKTMQTLAGSQR